MATIIDTSGDEAVARSDLKTPADAAGSEIKKTVVVVDNCLIGEKEEIIEFVLDERFRDKVDDALSELINNAILFKDEEGRAARDRSTAITLDLEAEGKVFASIIMKHDLFRDNELPKRIDKEFSELI